MPYIVTEQTSLCGDDKRGHINSLEPEYKNSLTKLLILIFTALPWVHLLSHQPEVFLCYWLIYHPWLIYHVCFLFSDIFACICTSYIMHKYDHTHVYTYKPTHLSGHVCDFTCLAKYFPILLYFTNNPTWKFITKLC